MHRFIPVVVAVVVAGTALGQWEPDIRLSVTPEPSETPLSGRGIAASGSGVHVVWQEGWNPWDHEFPEIYYARSADSGASWEFQHRLTVDSASSENPSVAAASPYVYVTWQDLRVVPTGIFFKRSTDDGATWSEDRQVSDATGSNPIICDDDSILHLVHVDWRQGLNLAYYRRSTDRGLTWMPEQQLTDTGHSYAPAVAVSGGKVHVAWYDYRDGNAEIYYRRSGDRGLTWGPAQRLTEDSLVSLEPVIAGSGTDVHLMWKEYRLGGEWTQRILYRRSTDAGETWSEQARLTPDSIDAYYLSVAASGQQVHLAWMGHPKSNQESHIYYARSADRGVTWTPQVCLTDSVSDYALIPSLAVSGPAVHVAWCERRDTIAYEEVYYRRSPEGNTAFAEGGGRRIRYRGRPAATVISGSMLSVTHVAVLLDVAGRRVKVLEPGLNDVRHVAPGVYFVTPSPQSSPARGEEAAVRKAVIQR
jgi:hypothetical protein